MGEPQLPPNAVIMNMVMGSWIAQAIGAAARLGLADALRHGPTDSGQVATRIGADADSTRRLLRTLAGLGVVAATADGQWTLTPIGECLRSDVPGSMRDFAIAETDHAHWTTWERFTDAVRSGAPQAEAALGSKPWVYYGEHPEDGAHFSRAMAGISGLAIGPVLEHIDFTGQDLIADIGGAHGTLLAAILTANPAARGILFDLPHVVEVARPSLEQAGLASRVTPHGGSFFDGAMPTADVYLLKHILHDWADEESVAILRNIRAGMKPSSRVLVIELVVPDPVQPGPALFMDLNMMVMLGGKERTAAEYDVLLQRAGLRTSRVITTQGPIGIIEAVGA
jgi:O-methyltransferase domain/Dimerisation domain